MSMKRFLASLATFSLVLAIATFVLVKLIVHPAISSSLMLTGAGGAGSVTPPPTGNSTAILLTARVF